MIDDNWEQLIKECEGLYGGLYKDRDGAFHRFFGLVHTDEDYYYGMTRLSGGMRLLSCVASFETHDFVLVEK